VGWDFFVSAGVHTPAEMPRSGNTETEKQPKLFLNKRERYGCFYKKLKFLLITQIILFDLLSFELNHAMPVLPMEVPYLVLDADPEV
jgi:hypothetical protein